MVLVAVGMGVAPLASVAFADDIKRQSMPEDAMSKKEHGQKWPGSRIRGLGSFVD
jgi:hypothetical protein